MNVPSQSVVTPLCLKVFVKLQENDVERDVEMQKNATWWKAGSCIHRILAGHAWGLTLTWHCCVRLHFGLIVTPRSVGAVGSGAAQRWSLSGFLSQFCAKWKRYSKTFYKTQLWMVCDLKLGFFFRDSSYRSLSSESSFPFALHVVMWLKYKNGFHFKLVKYCFIKSSEKINTMWA